MTQRPLEGLRAVVTSPKRSPDLLVRGLAEAGAEAVVVPLVEIADPESWAPLDSALEELARGSFDWLALASVSAADRVVARLEAIGRHIPPETRVASVGPSSADLFRRNGIDVDVVARPHTAEALVSRIGDGRGRVLLPRVAEGPREFPDSLAARGWDVHEVPAYRNLRVPGDSPGLAVITTGDFHIITLTSASAARNLAALVSPSAIGLQLGGDAAKAVACIGPSTARAARAAGLRADVVAETHTLAGLVEAIIVNLRGMAR